VKLLLLDCRLIVDSPAPGPWNMAADEALLLAAAESGVATLRFYQWSKPTLSLGYFQSYEDRRQHPASQKCAVVRRQTGGGAILHDRELTYSLTLPASHPLARNSQQLYTAVHDAFVAALKPFIVTQTSAWKLCQVNQRPKGSATQEPFLCFARRACGDVLLVNGNDNRSKLLGSAQRRHRGAILQHGSLLVERSPFAPELAGWLDLTGVALSMDRLIDSLAVAIADTLALRAIPGRLPFELQSNADQLANTKYGHAAWTKRR
jgi:lipoate-protein ligase A